MQLFTICFCNIFAPIKWKEKQDQSTAKKQPKKSQKLKLKKKRREEKKIKLNVGKLITDKSLWR